MKEKNSEWKKEWYFKDMERKRKRKRKKIVCILVYICLNNIEKSDTSGFSLLPQKKKGGEANGRTSGINPRLV